MAPLPPALPGGGAWPVRFHCSLTSVSISKSVAVLTRRADGGVPRGALALVPYLLLYEFNNCCKFKIDVWSPHEDLNLELSLRRGLLYPVKR